MRAKQAFWTLMIAFYFWGCQSRSSGNYVTHFPKIIDTLPQTEKYFIAKEMQVSKTPIILTANLDTIQISTAFHSDFSDYADFEEMNDSNLVKTGLQIFVDTNQIVTINLSDYQPLPPPITMDTISFEYYSLVAKKMSDEWSKRPKTLVRGYPVYLYNMSDSSIYLDNQDLKAFLIQEAKNNYGEWNPIEYWYYSWCGNSYGAIKLQPKHFALVKIITYDGNFQTELRVKVRNGNNKFYSNTFQGKINLSQFELPGDYKDNRLSKRLPDDRYLKQMFLDK